MFCPPKPLEVREGNVKPSNYKVCVLGLWAAEDAQCKRLVELADALESGRLVTLSHLLSLVFVLVTHRPSFLPSSDWRTVILVALTLNVWLLLVWLIMFWSCSRTALCRFLSEEVYVQNSFCRALKHVHFSLCLGGSG